MFHGSQPPYGMLNAIVRHAPKMVHWRMGDIEVGIEIGTGELENGTRPVTPFLSCTVPLTLYHYTSHHTHRTHHHTVTNLTNPSAFHCLTILVLINLH
jgi:hypothetical protein